MNKIDVVKTMYEVNWHYTNDTLTKITVTPITVLREGVLPGCKGMSITARDHTGRTFQGSPENYFDTEAKAWESARRDLQGTIDALEAEVTKATIEIDANFKVLCAISGKGEA